MLVTVNMNDDYGDGWNGNILTISSETLGVQEFTLFAGYDGNADLGFCPFECDDIVDVSVADGDTALGFCYY